MSEYVDFHYMPLEGKITGEQVLKQTEDAINDLGNKVYNLDIDESRIDEAVEKSEQAIETAESALSAVTTDRAVWKNTVAEMKATNIDLGVTAATRGKMVFNDGNGAFYGVRSEKSGDVDSDDTVFLNNGNVAERIQSMNIIAKGNNIIFVANVAELIDSDALIGNVYGTTGYHAANDEGAGVYTIRTKTQSDVEDGGSVIFLENGNVAELITDGTVNVKQFGAKGDGVTGCRVAINNAMNYASAHGLQCIINSGTFLIDLLVFDWRGNDAGLGIEIPSNSNILIDHATILCETNNYVRYELFKIADVENIYIKGVDAVIKGDRTTHTGNTGEWGHGVYIDYNASNVIVDGLTVKDCWGDGFSVGGLLATRVKNVKILNCISDNNRRQAITIGGCSNLIVDHCQFLNTNGTAPQAGIDLEPGSYSLNENITISNCVISGNAGRAIAIENYNRGIIISECDINGDFNVYRSDINTGTLENVNVLQCSINGRVSITNIVGVLIQNCSLYCDRASTTTLTLSYNTNVVVDACEIVNEQFNAIYFAVVNSGADFNTYCNTIKNCNIQSKSTGYNAILSYKAGNIILENNIINSAATVDAAIRESSDFNGTLNIRNNRIISKSTGLSLRGGSMVADVDGNHITYNIKGIVIQSSSGADVLLRNNHIVADTDVPDSPIYFTSSTLNVYREYLNIYEGSVTKAYSGQPSVCVRILQDGTVVTTI